MKWLSTTIKIPFFFHIFFLTVHSLTEMAVSTVEARTASLLVWVWMSMMCENIMK